MKQYVEEVKKEFVSMCWCFAKVKEGESFDELFDEAERRYYKLLERAMRDYELKHWIKHDLSEGFEHIALKMIVAEALAKELGAKSRSQVLDMLKSRRIEAEHEIETGKRRADLYVGEKQLYVEVETFYGTRDPIADKLDYEGPSGELGTLRKYVGEFILWSATQTWLIFEGIKYPKLSGVVFMRYDVKTKKDQVGTWLIPVINPYAENPLDPKLLLKNVVLPTPSFGARHLLILPTHIYIPKPGWMDLIQLEPGFKLTYKGIYFGTII